jgi:hypothetical protein
MSFTGDYLAMMSWAEENPEEADFVALREAYTVSDQYRPTSHFSTNKLIGNTNSLSTFEEIIAFCQDVLEHNPMDLEIRMMLHYALEKAGYKTEATHQQAFIRNMLSAIFSSGDGKSIGTAWKVVSVAEEYTVLSVLGYKAQGQRLMNQDGNWYDILTCVKRTEQDAPPVEIYFEINAPYEYLQTMMLEDE